MAHRRQYRTSSLPNAANPVRPGLSVARCSWGVEKRGAPLVLDACSALSIKTAPAYGELTSMLVRTHPRTNGRASNFKNAPKSAAKAVKNDADPEPGTTNALGLLCAFSTNASKSLRQAATSSCFGCACFQRISKSRRGPRSIKKDRI